MGGSGISAMINVGATLELEFENLIVVSIGRPAVGDEDDCEMQIYGAQLAYRITLRAGGVTLGAALMDSAEGAWDLLLRAADNPAGWQTVRGLIAALERHGVKSLERPIEAGTGEFGWVIG